MQTVNRALIVLMSCHALIACDESEQASEQSANEAGNQMIAGESAGDSAGNSVGGTAINGGEAGAETGGEAGGSEAGMVAGESAGESAGNEAGEIMPYLPLDPCLAVKEGEPSPTEGVYNDSRGEFRVSVEGEGCERIFNLESTAPQRDPNDALNRRLTEASHSSLHSHNPLTDALYALAVTETEECSVDSISDGAFLNGAGLSCDPGGCFETGALWTYVWTRDTAYSVDLGLALADPTRATNSLRFKLSARRDGSAPQIIQDTGSGGSYPISTDRSVWALGARAALSTLKGEERSRFELEAYEAMKNTIEHDRIMIYDPRDGLYRGEQSFLDWREQSYPEWVANDVVHLGMSKSLSTNIGHYALLSFVTELAERAGDVEQYTTYSEWAESLKTSINDRLWLDDVGQYSTFIPTTLDPTAAYRYDLLGSALAISTGVASEAQARRIISSYPLFPHGPAVQWPQLREIPIYHNRGIWPFVTAYGLRAARKVGHPTAVNLLIESILSGAGLNLSNMENLDAGTGLAFAEDGWLSGPVVNSRRQLWSVAGALGLFHEHIFGLTPSLEGLKVEPWITEYTRQNTLGGSSQVSLAGLKWGGHKLDVILRFDVETDEINEGISIESPLVWTAKSWLLDGQNLEKGLLPFELMNEGVNRQLVVTLELNTIDEPDPLTLINPTDEEAYYAPRTPYITNATRTDSSITLDLNFSGNEANSMRALNIYRDGQLIAEGLSLSSIWTDEQAPLGETLCYTAELVSTQSGNRSQRAQPWCVWTQIDTLYAGEFLAIGGTLIDQYDRIHYQGWGAPQDQLSVEWIASRSGQALIQAEYGNGAGAINTGVTCAVKRLDLIALPENQASGGGYLMMPHLGQWDRWSDSNFINVELIEGVRYRLVVKQDDYSINMSEFEHFASYTGGNGGVGGPFNDVNISALKVLYLE